MLLERRQMVVDRALVHLQGVRQFGHAGAISFEHGLEQFGTSSRQI